MSGTLRGNRGVFLVALVLIWSVVVLAILAVAIWADPPGEAWWGILLPVSVATFLSIVSYVLLWHERPTSGVPVEQRAPVPPDVHRIIVVANEALRGPTLREEIRRKAAERPTEVLVVAPALSGAFSHWADDEDASRRAAAARLDDTCHTLEGLGVRARGEVGPDDPLVAVADAIRTFGADEIVVSTHPDDKANWLELGVVDRLRDFYDIPVVHVLVDEDREEVHPPVPA